MRIASNTFRFCCVVGLVLALIRVDQLQAQKKGVPRPPQLNPPFPFGIQRGTTLDLTLTGSHLTEPTGVWTSFPARVTIPNTGKNGKESNRLQVRLEVPRTAPVGFHGLRLATRLGISNLVLFCVDDLPQVTEVTTNNSPARAQKIAPPCVVVGKADTERTDYFKFKVAAGQRLCFAVQGRRLGSTFDPQLTLLDASTGRDLSGGYNAGAAGLQSDPRLSYTFTQAGEYLVAIRDISYRGAANYHYRLRIGDFPDATIPLPMGARRGTTASLAFAGRDVANVNALKIAIPDDPTLKVLSLVPRKGSGGLPGWPVYLAVSDLPEAMEQEPNETPGKANTLQVPGALTGRFLKKNDRDYFAFSARKGQRILLQVQTDELGSPAEVYMVLSDSKGKALLKSKPTQAARLSFTAGADGRYILMVEHLHYWSGPVQAYRLTATPATPDFSLSLAIDRFTVTQGGKVNVPVQVTRAGYEGPIEVSVLGSAKVQGEATVPAGLPKKAGQVGVQVPLQASADAPLGAKGFQIVGKATIDGKKVVRVATVTTVLRQSLGNLSQPPPTLVTQLGLGITEKPPFTLTAAVGASKVKRGKPIPITVNVNRAPGFAGPITLSGLGLPANVSLAIKPIPAGKTEAKGQLSTSKKAAPGRHSIRVMGTAQHQKHTVQGSTPPVSVVITK